MARARKLAGPLDIAKKGLKHKFAALDVNGGQCCADHASTFKLSTAVDLTNTSDYQFSFLFICTCCPGIISLPKMWISLALALALSS